MSSGFWNSFCRIADRLKVTCAPRVRQGCVVVGVAGVTAAAIATPVFASELVVHPTKLKWPHDGLLASHDHASLRRGYQVYKQVCAACHSMKYLSYRMLVGHVLTETEAKAECAEIQVKDGPNDQGEMYDRPGRLSDFLPLPFPNNEAARAANGGALPPDLTFITKARHGFEDYVFHLLTGYCDAPEGREVGENQHYNPYFPGGVLGMAPPLYDEVIEYEDGTPATLSQMAKDVCCFLTWSSERNHDKRKRVLFKGVILLSIAAVLAGIYKRKKWSNIKTRKLMYKNRPIPKDL